MRPAKISGLVALTLTIVGSGLGSLELHARAQKYATEGRTTAAVKARDYSDTLGVCSLLGGWTLLTLGLGSVIYNPKQEEIKIQRELEIMKNGGPLFY